MWQVVHLMKAADEVSRKEMIARMGITDGAVDLAAYTESLRLGIDEAVHIGETLRSHITADKKEHVENRASAGRLPNR